MTTCPNPTCGSSVIELLGVALSSDGDHTNLLWACIECECQWSSVDE